MKHSSFGLVAALGLVLLSAAPVATGSIYGSGEGYYYVAYSYSTGYPPGYQYMKVGPFATEEDCWQARNDDYGNGDSWLPYDGSGIQCDWIFHNEVSAFDDALADWNALSGGGNTPPVVIGVEQIQAIAELQRRYGIERYKRDVSEVLRARR
jgi:hypothetical protein